jgi:hypothetical protein
VVKDSQKHLVGQPIFKQIIQMISWYEFAAIPNDVDAVAFAGDACEAGD